MAHGTDFFPFQSWATASSSSSVPWRKKNMWPWLTAMGHQRTHRIDHTFSGKLYMLEDHHCSAAICRLSESWSTDSCMSSPWIDEGLSFPGRAGVCPSMPHMLQVRCLLISPEINRSPLCAPTNSTSPKLTRWGRGLFDALQLFSGMVLQWANADTGGTFGTSACLGYLPWNC